MKAELYYIQHNDNLEGLKEDFLFSKLIDIEGLKYEIEDLAENSDGERSYEPLFLLDLSRKIIQKF